MCVVHLFTGGRFFTCWCCIYVCVVHVWACGVFMHMWYIYLLVGDACGAYICVCGTYMYVW